MIEGKKQIKQKDNGQNPHAELNLQMGNRSLNVGRNRRAQHLQDEQRPVDKINSDGSRNHQQGGAGILHWSYDQIFDAIHFYRLDAVVFLNLVRIPWWSLAEYLADPADDIDRATAEYLQSIPRREGGFSRAG